MRFMANVAALIVAVMFFGSLASVCAQHSEVMDSGLTLKEEIAKRTINPAYTPMIGETDNGPAAGERAPDFSLTPLKFYDFKTEEQDITLENAEVLYENVRLSDFRGKKPVALIFGSYT